MSSPQPLLSHPPKDSPVLLDRELRVPFLSQPCNRHPEKGPALEHGLQPHCCHLQELSWNCPHSLLHSTLPGTPGGELGAEVRHSLPWDLPPHFLTPTPTPGTRSCGARHPRVRPALFPELLCQSTQRLCVTPAPTRQPLLGQSQSTFHSSSPSQPELLGARGEPCSQFPRAVGDRSQCPVRVNCTGLCPRGAQRGGGAESPRCGRGRVLGTIPAVSRQLRKGCWPRRQPAGGP